MQSGGTAARERPILDNLFGLPTPVYLAATHHQSMAQLSQFIPTVVHQGLDTEFPAAIATRYTVATSQTTLGVRRGPLGSASQ